MLMELYTRFAWHAIELKERLRRQRGQGMVEYGLILVLVAIAVIATLTLLGGKLLAVFNYVQTQLVT